MISWSLLVSELLENVVDLLLLADRHRFSAVCHNWRVVAKQKRHCRVEELPWLVLGEDITTKKRNFFNLSEQRHYFIDIPELYEHYICGSSYGWLFTVDKRINARLLNPFTRELYSLPPLPPYDTRYNVGTYTVDPVFKSNGRRCGYTFDEMQKKIVSKAFLSHDPIERSDFIVFIIVGMSDQTAFWRPGDTDWTVLSHRERLKDVICFEEIFYAISYSDMLYSIDVGSDPKITRIAPQLLLSNDYPIARCLLNFKGKLLVVQMFKYKPEVPLELLRYMSRESFYSHFKSFKDEPIELRVLHYNVKAPDLCELHDIDDLALFVGNNSAAIFGPSEHSRYVKNGIYFADMIDTYREAWGHDFGVYHVVDKTMGQFCQGDDQLFHPTDALLTWLTPRL